jgi:hypothetical protein
MSFHNYLHEKAEESRHNETLAYLMFLAGVIFLVGGILETLSLNGTPSWFVIVPYFPEATAGVFLGWAMIISGLGLMVFGLASGFIYSRDRGWYMQELRKSGTAEDGSTSKKGGKLTKKGIGAKI